MSDFHGRMMNVQGSENGGMSYKFGHRDARHACAEIALEADDRIATLEARNERLRDALRMLLDCPHIADRHLYSWSNPQTEVAVYLARAAFAEDGGPDA